VWDVRTIKCIQTISAFKNDPAFNAFSIAFDDEKACMVVGDFGVVKWPVAVNPVVQVR